MDFNKNTFWPIIVIWATTYYMSRFVLLYQPQKLLFFNLTAQPNKYIFMQHDNSVITSQGISAQTTFMFVQIVLKNTYTPTRRIEWYLTE